MLLGRPARTGGGPALSNNRRFLRICVIERLLHPAALAICDVVSNLLCIIWQINSRFHGSRFRAILLVSRLVVYSFGSIFKRLCFDSFELMQCGLYSQYNHNTEDLPTSLRNTIPYRFQNKSKYFLTIYGWYPHQWSWHLGSGNKFFSV